MKRNFKKVSKGFTLIELLITMAIIGLAVYAIIGQTTGASNSSAIQTEQKNLQQISQVVHSVYGPTDSYSTVTTSAVKAAGGFPTQMVVGTNIINSWGGSVTVIPDTINGGIGYDIVYPNIPQASCIQLASQINGQYPYMKIQNTTNASTDWSGSTIAAACVSGTNTITFNGL